MGLLERLPLPYIVSVRGLVDNLNSHGFCASYSELRRFLTSVALKEEDSTKEGVYVIDGIVPVCQGGCLVQEGADNIDINTETIYGKGSLSSKPITYRLMYTTGVSLNAVKISFSVHHSKKADSHSDNKASYTNVNARTARLNCLPVIICSTDPAAYTEDSINRSFNPPSPQNLPIDATKHDIV
jgi:hypothetical protein